MSFLKRKESRSQSLLYEPGAKKSKSRQEGSPDITAESTLVQATSNMAPNANTSFIVRFYDPEVKAPDTKDRDLDFMLQQDNQWFEACHNYVQVLFPLPEESMFNYHAPRIERDTFDAFRSRPELRAEMRKAFTRMLSFYGLDLRTDPTTNHEPSDAAKASNDNTRASNDDEGIEVPETANLATANNENTKVVETAEAASTEYDDITIMKSQDYQRRFRNWVTRFNHNHLRITRILRSLRVLGLKKEADAFFAALETVQAEHGKFSDQSLMYWRRAVEQPLWTAPDGEKVPWLRGLEDETSQA